MKKTYFLTAVFENKFGKAKKYYDGDSWHWMLNSDKPELYESLEEAKKKARMLAEEDLMDLSIKEVNVYEGVWEHKIQREDISSFLQKNGQPRQVIFYQEQKKQYVFLSKEKQIETPLLIEGLYCIDRKQDGWIYCVKRQQQPETKSMKPTDLIYHAYQKLTEAKAFLILLEEAQKVEKVESLLLLMKKIIPPERFQTPYEEEELATSPQKILQSAYQKLEEAQKIAIKLNEDEKMLEHITRLQLFCRRLL